MTVRLFIVDDEPGILRAYARCLKCFGDFEIRTFLTPSELLETLELQRAGGWPQPDVVLTDYDMGPGELNGEELTAELCKRDYTGVIIVNSGRSHAKPEKAAAMLRKPVKLRKLAELIDDLVEGGVTGMTA